MTKEQIIAMLRGTAISVELTLASIAIGIVLAFIIAFFRMSKNKALKGIGWVYIWVFRGTPLLLQIMVIYYAIPIMYRETFGNTLLMPMFTSAVLAFTLNTAAYIAEIIRAGIESIDNGQMEASKALGMSYWQAMIHVIIPQTFKRLIPPFSNEFIMILKDTSLISVIGMAELMKVSRQFAANGDWGFYFYAGAIYLFLTTIFSVAFDKLEKFAGKYE
ncbi:MAG: amino acid ABC transporter permease [Anaerofustis sp.]